MALKLGKCRLCLKLGDFFSIFTVDESLQLAEMVMECTRIKVYEGDGLPDKVCSECVQKLSSAYIFKQQCERSDQELRRNYVPPPGFSIAPSPNRQSSDSAFSSQTEASNQNKAAEAKTAPTARRKRSRDSVSNSSVASRQEYRPSPKNQRVEEIKKNAKRKNYDSDEDYEDASGSHLSVDTDSDEPLLNEHSCNICHRTFRSKKSVAVHKRTHTNADKSFGSNAVVDIPKKTMEDAIDDDQKLACDKCGKTFKLKIMLKRHYDTCEKQTTSTPQKELHVALETINPDKKYSCEMCPTKFKTVDNLEKHMRVCHAAVLKNKEAEPREKQKKVAPQPAKVTVPCIYCESEFDDYYIHCAHLLECPKKTKSLSFQCPLCPRVTYKQSSYFMHIKNVHFEPRCGQSQETPKAENFQCRMCNKQLPNQEQLIQHLAAHVSNIDDSTNADDDDGTEAPTPTAEPCDTGVAPDGLQCRHCDKTFTYKKALYTHEMKHTEDEMKTEPPDPPDTDVTSTFNEDEEESDDDQEDGDNTCDICEKMFSYKRLLINHKRTKHNMSSGTKRANVSLKNCSVKCQICDDQMLVGDSLEHNKYHLSRNEKPRNLYTCSAENCGETFKSCQTLSTHIKMVHRLKKLASKRMSLPNMADFCEVVVTKSEPLDAVQSHSGGGEVPTSYQAQGVAGFTCPTCGKQMPTLISLKRHVNWHANVGNHLERSLECFVCKETFRFKGHYRLHMRSHYNDTALDPKFLTCSICGRRSKHLRAAQAHMNYHKQTRFQGKDYRCAICGRMFQARKVYLSHMAVHFKRGESGQNTIVGEQLSAAAAAAAGPNVCHLCGKQCLSEVSLKHHLIWHKSKTLLFGSLHQCHLCSVKFTNKSHLKLHIRTHYEDEAGPFKCSICGKGYTDEEYFRRHVKGHNFDHQSHAKRIAKLRENKVKCPICERYYPDLPKLIRHLRRTHPQSKMIKEDPDAPPRRVFPCKLCAKVFHDERRFQFHQESHLRKPTHFTCKFCFKTCLSQKLFNVHVRAHLYKKHADNPWRCEHCDEKFVRALELQRHLKSVHDITETWEAPKDAQRHHAPLKELQCSICFKVLASKGNYERHIDFHNTLRCNYCFEYFSGSRFLEGHLAFSCEKRKLIGETETVPRRIKCEICYKAFHVQVKLDCHMRAKHGVLVAKKRVEATIDITCDFCFRVFENEDALASHRLYHRSVGFFGCIYCERKFNSVTTYNKHKNHHFSQINTETPFKCEHCDETFEPFRDMIYHMRDVHQDDKEWLVMPKEVTEEHCPICDKDFYNLPRHLAYHEENRCKKCLEYFFSRVDFDQHLCAVDSDAEEGTPDKPPPNYEECPFCFKQYTRAGSEKMHRNLHQTSGSISCRFCCLKFKTIDAFNIHAFSHRSKKYKRKPLKCRDCGEKFIQYGLFMKHIRGVHGRKEKMHYRTKVKPERCVICHGDFPNLHNHYRAHQQNHCDKCGKYFTSSRVFSYHECDKEDIDPTKVFTSDVDLVNLIKNYRPKDERDDEKFYDITDDEEDDENEIGNVGKFSKAKESTQYKYGSTESTLREDETHMIQEPDIMQIDEDSHNGDMTHLMPLSIQSPIISDVLSLYQEKKPDDVIDLVDEDSVGFEAVPVEIVTIDDD